MRYACLALALLGVAVLRPAAADTVGAVTTPGHGELTVCRNWVVYRACKPYDKVKLPRRVAVGDKLTLSFGSNPKDYVFHVLEIRPKGAGCLLLSAASAGMEDRERLAIIQCDRASEAR
jgi:hypothetical protein